MAIEKNIKKNVCEERSCSSHVLKIQSDLSTPLHLHDLWAYRELFFFLIWRDLKIRYKQTVLGVLWVILQPICTMLVFSLFFGKFAHLPSDGQIYPVFVLTALLPWLFFSNGLTTAGNSLVGDGNLIKKVYFPRIFIPLAKVFGGLVDFAIGLFLLIAIALFYGIFPTTRWLLIPFELIFILAATTGISIFFATLNVLFRDVKHILPFLVQIWLFVSPVVYPPSLIPEQGRLLYALNPMVGVIECFRWIILGTTTLTLGMLCVSLIMTVVIFVASLLYFNSIEEHFADVV